MSNLLRRRFRYNYCNATVILAIVNVIFFGLTYFIPNIRYFLGLNPSLVIYYRMYWQPLTCTFIHANFQHLFFNMLGLVMFGIPVEKSIGSKEFLLFYFVCGTISSLLSLLVYILGGSWNVLLMGASGALYAVLFAFAVIFPTVKVFIFGIIPVPGPILIILYTIIEIGSQLLGLGGNVAHLTHLFGFAAAWAYFVIRIGVNPIKIWKNAFRH